MKTDGAVVSIIAHQMINADIVTTQQQCGAQMSGYAKRLCTHVNSALISSHINELG